MAKLNKGIFGGFSGKIGNVVGASWMGESNIRSLPGKRKTDDSRAQKVQQTKFGFLAKFLKTFGRLFSISFKNYPGRMTPYNAVTSYNILNAVSGDYPDFEIDYPLIRLCQGNLFTAVNAAAKPGEIGGVEFSWMNKEKSTAVLTDSAVLIVYNPITKKAIYKLKGALRQDETASLDIPEFTGYTVETWIAFLSADAKNISNSVYTGRVNIM